MYIPKCSLMVVAALTLSIVSPAFATTGPNDNGFEKSHEKAFAIKQIYNDALSLPTNTNENKPTIRIFHNTNFEKSTIDTFSTLYTDPYGVTTIKSGKTTFEVSIRHFIDPNTKVDLPIGFLIYKEKDAAGTIHTMEFSDMNLQGEVMMAFTKKAENITNFFYPLGEFYQNLTSQGKLLLHAEWQKKYDEQLEHLRLLINAKTHERILATSLIQQL